MLLHCTLVQFCLLKIPNPYEHTGWLILWLKCFPFNFYQIKFRKSPHVRNFHPTMFFRSQTGKIKSRNACVYSKNQILMSFIKQAQSRCVTEWNFQTSSHSSFFSGFWWISGCYFIDVMFLLSKHQFVTRRYFIKNASLCTERVWRSMQHKLGR